MAQNFKQVTSIIGDELVIRVLAKDDSIDFTAYTIASELRTNGGDGTLAGTFTIVKDLPDVAGKIVGFTAILSASVTALLIPKINYGLDYKIGLGSAVKHSERVVVKFEKAVSIS